MVRSRESYTLRSGRRAYLKDRLSTASLLQKTRRVPTRWLRPRQTAPGWDARVIADCRWPIADGKLEAKIQLGCAKMGRAMVIELPAGKKMFRWLRVTVRMIRFGFPAANSSPNRSKILYGSAVTKKQNLRCVPDDSRDRHHSHSVAREFLYRWHLVRATGDVPRARLSALLDLDYCSR